MNQQDPNQMAQLIAQQAAINAQMNNQQYPAPGGMMPNPMAGMMPQQGGATVVLLPMKIETPMGRLRYYQQFEMPAGMHILSFVQQLMMQGVPVDLYQQQQNGGGWNRGGGGGGWNRGGGFNGGGGRW